MSEYEIYSYEAFRKRIRDDIRTIDNARVQLLDEKRMEDYLDAGLPSPIFSVVHGEFKVVMKNGYNEEAKSIPESVVEFCSTPRTRAELIAFTGKSRTYTMTKIIQPLVDSGKLELTLPEKPKSSKQKFVRAIRNP